MKKIVLTILALCSGLVSGEAEVKVGDASVLVDAWEWVVVKNPNGIKNENGFFGFGDSCGVQAGNRITILGIKDNILLVRYNNIKKEYGTPCPDNTVYMKEKSTWVSMEKGLKIIEDRKKKIDEEKSWILKQM